MATLLAVVEAGSLSAASRRLSTPLATVSRRLSELEAHLKTRLLQRSSRRITLTDAGAAYIEACRRILDQIEEAERTASGEYQSPKGELNVAASPVLGRRHVVPVAAAFLQAYPEVLLHLRLSNRVVNLQEEHVDIAIRTGALPDSSLIARHLGTVRWVVCASPGYLARRGRPETPRDLSAHDGWRAALEPVIARYRSSVRRLYFRGDAAFANPEICEFLEAKGIGYAIRLPANRVLQDRIGYLLKRPVGRPPHQVRRHYASFSYRAQSWDKSRHVVAKVEWHPGELYPRVGFIVSNLARSTERIVAFYNQRGTCEQYIKEGKNAIKWTRLSCRTFAANAVRLQLHTLAYNLGNFMRTLAMPKTADPWSLTSLREKLIKIGAKVVAHGRYVTFQMAEVAVPRQMFADILSLIARLRAPPAPA